MSYLDALRSALRALRANIMRSALTMLGIIIGVAAVILVVAIGSGAREVVIRQIRSLGSNLLVIDSRAVPGGGRFLRDGDATAIGHDVSSILASVPVLRGNVVAAHGDANLVTTLWGSSPDFLVARDWDLADGRNFTGEETSGGSKVVLLGDTVARTLFGDVDPLGGVVRIQGTPFTVIGLLAAKGQTTSGKDQDDLVVTPLKTARARVLGINPAIPDRVDSILVKADDDVADMGAIEDDVSALLRGQHRLLPAQEDDFTIKNLAEVLQIKQASAGALASLVAAIASVSLLVGGIGIMNIMLVSVVERTREIGIRMAVGARRRDILAQFLVEAMTLSTIGGGIGVLIGIIGAGITASLAQWPWVINPLAVFLAVGFSISVGVVFGFYPARRAAWLDPIEALRHE